jgi:glycine/D-amino acid oxidase-like deaminating enzyme
MLSLKDLSFWEKSVYLQNIDFCVVGAGIVGLSTAIFLRNNYPDAKILILERGYLPTGASTKNAGFACFGSPTEIYDDLKTISENAVWETFLMRYEGLEMLFEIIEPNLFSYQNCASWDLIQSRDELLPVDFLNYLNDKVKSLIGQEHVYQEETDIIEKSGFKNIIAAYKNRLEGSINTGALIHCLYKKAIAQDIHVLFGIELEDFDTCQESVELKTNFGFIKTSNLIICTNGFARKVIGERIKPARAQVLVTKPIRDLKFEGTFHFDRGYYYFRNVENRVLLGGGRNLDINGETTEEIKTTGQIQEKLVSLLENVILPNTPFEVDYSWAGIMGVGNEKQPIIEKLNNRVAIGVRMGGMGVAIGAAVGKKLANLF